MTRLINLTNHNINIIDKHNNTIKTIPPSGIKANLIIKNVSTGMNIAGIPLTQTQYKEENPLPPEQIGTYYIVSKVVKAAFPTRKDLLVPTEVQTTEDGRKIGCRSLGL
jgi:hypothetical protein